MPVPDAMVRAAHDQVYAKLTHFAPSDTRRALVAAIAWLRSDTPEAVEVRRRMAQAMLSLHPQRFIVRGGIDAALAVLAGDE